jgi:hypothetical protein
MSLNLAMIGLTALGLMKKPLLNTLLITKIKINPHVPQATPKRVIDNKNKNKPTCPSILQ